MVRLRSRRVAWLVLLFVPAAEVAAHVAIRSHIPAASHYKLAAEFVRARFEPGDLVVAAPSWIDPLVRQAAGSFIDAKQAGRSDFASFKRLWAVSIRGHDPPEAPRQDASTTAWFGPVQVRLWELGPSPVRFDFLDHIAEARVALVEEGVERPCTYGRGPGGNPGGLGRGPMWPEVRFRCDPKRPWLWVGATITEDLELQPRRCVWQHPAGREPVRVTFTDIPLSEHLVLYGGLYYEHERMREGGPVLVDVRLDGRLLGQLVHEDGDGWKRLVVPTGRTQGQGTVSVEVRAPTPHLRTFCWAATLRKTPPR